MNPSPTLLSWMKLNKYRLFWTAQGVVTDFRSESAFRRLLARLGLDRGRLYRGVRILYAYDVDGAHTDGKSYTVVKLACVTGNFSVGCHPKGLSAEEAIDKIIDGESAANLVLRDFVLTKRPADHVPWAIHCIPDPVARAEALQAFESNMLTSGDVRSSPKETSK